MYNLTFLIAAGILFHRNFAFALTKPYKKVVSNAMTTWHTCTSLHPVTIPSSATDEANTTVLS